MPEMKQAAFIWYHAEARLAETLQAWVKSTGKALGITSRLMVRHQADKTTFMEVYESTHDMEDIVKCIEARAAKQAWFSELDCQRKAEIFSEIHS